MPRYQYERLSDQDNDFLQWESAKLPMHVASLQILDAGPLRNEHGGVDFEAIKHLTESILHRIPRYRQKLAWIPGENHAVWVDDPHFNIDYHVRHTSLPRPGTDAQLKRLMSRIMEQPLDRARPLWETWVVEGLEGDRFATISKIHHCMIDGASGVQLTELLFSRKPERKIRKAPRFIPRPRPSDAELRSAERLRRLSAPLSAARKLVDFARDSEDPAGEILRRARSIGRLATWKTNPASATPINGEVGLHRSVEWAAMSLADIKAVRRALSCSVNDIVLTIVTGAIRKLMQRRQVDPASLDFRVSAPVNVRRELRTGEMGNNVSSWVVRLPIDEEEPLAQLEELHRTTQALKESDDAAAVKAITEVLDWLPLDTQSLSVGTMNTIVTNVPGPPYPLYMLGAEVLQLIPFAPLLQNLGLTIGVISYNGQVLWGLNADMDLLPDLDDFRVAIQKSFVRLADAAGVHLGESAPRVGALTSGAEPAAGGEPRAGEAAGPAAEAAASPSPARSAAEQTDTGLAESLSDAALPGNPPRAV
jgi:WS/DGAT/MGAT family acyltransferase